MSLEVIRGWRGKGMEKVFARAMAEMDDCDGVVILMQRKSGGISWFALEEMRLETMVFYLWSVLNKFGLMAIGKI